MNRETVMQNLIKAGVVPVVRAKSRKNLLKVVEALISGGLSIAEITMTIPSALESIEQCAKTFGDALTLGAGTITDSATCLRAIDSGSHFVVTPTVNLDVLNLCRKKDTCVIGGALTPTEILSVWEAGADAIKVFPAKAMGGPQYIKMLHEPLPHVPLVPTGGVSLETLADYFKAGAIFVGAGGDLVNKEAVDSGRVDVIRERARRYCRQIQGVRADGLYS